MLHSQAEYGAYFSWTVPISGASLAIVDSLRHWACKRGAHGLPPSAGARQQWPGWPQGFRLAGTSPYCKSTYCPFQRSQSAGEARESLPPPAPISWHQRRAPAHQPEKVSMLSMNRSCSPPARAVPCGGLCRAQPLGDPDDPGRPSILRGDPIADGSFRESYSLPAYSPVSRITAPTLTARRYPTLNTRDGTGVASA